MMFETKSRNPVSYFEVPFDEYTTGAVSLSLGENTTVGPEIKTWTSADGKVSAHRVPRMKPQYGYHR